MSTSELLAEASRLGDDLVKQAIWCDSSCTWRVVDAGNSRAGPTSLSTARGDLYQGTAGIALFLAELYGQTEVSRYRATAEAALRYAFKARTAHLNSVGLYSGRAGLAWAAGRVAAVTGSMEWREQSLRELDSIEAALPSDGVLDVVGGAAGAALVAASLPLMLGDTPRLRLLDRIGAHLERHAERRRGGWSWSGGGGSTKQNLCGYAHGASGIAHALLELYAATGSGRWRYAAERALAFERTHRVGRTGDWPDFRCTALSERLRAEGGVSSIRTALIAGQTVPHWKPTPMRAWCHGAPGIALTRMRAVSLAVDFDASMDEARAALAVTQSTMLQRLVSFSLCHGGFGNSETLMRAATGFGIGSIDPLREAAIAAVRDVHRRGGVWASGAVGAVPDPSLMLGTAGIGHYLLRLMDPSIPSALFVSFWADAPHGGETESAMEGRDTRHLLPTATTLMHRFEVLPRSQKVLDEALDSLTAPLGESAETNLDQWFPREMLVDALELDLAHVRAEESFDDYIEQFYAELARPAYVPDDVPLLRMHLAASVEIHVAKWAWHEWLRGTAREPVQECESYVFYRAQRAVCVQRLTSLEYTVLQQLARARSLNEVIRELSRDSAVSREVADALPCFVAEFAVRCLRAGILEPLCANVP